MSLKSLRPSQVALGDGAVINYVRAGKGPILIMLHGVMGDYRSWAPQWEAFTSHYDCIAISCRFNWPNPNTMEAPNHSAVENADDVAEIMELLGIPSAIVVGSSYGAFAALALAVNHSDRVRAIVGVEPPMMRYAELFKDTAPTATAFRESTVASSRAAFERGDDELGALLLTGGIQNVSVDAIPPEKLQQRIDNMMAGRRVALSTDEFPLLPPEKLGAISVPVMLITGAKTGPVFKAMFSAITRTIPQARAEVVEGAGHSVPVDQPAVFNRLTLDFLETSL